MRRGGLLWAVGALILAAACNQPESNPAVVISLFVDTVPAPSVVAGDTMRIGDSTALGQLTMHAFNINGTPLDVPISWITLDPAVVTVDGQGHVFASTDSVPAISRIVGQATDLQSLPIMINVTFRPDSLASDTADTAQLIRGACAAPISTPLIALLLHKTTFGDTLDGVDDYLVHWDITAPANLVGKQTGTIADTALLAFLVDASNNPSILDTTKNGGFSTRTLEFGSSAFAKSRMNDTLKITLQATARLHGRILRGPVPVHITFVNPTTC